MAKMCEVQKYKGAVEKFGEEITLIALRVLNDLGEEITVEKIEGFVLGYLTYAAEMADEVIEMLEEEN